MMRPSRREARVAHPYALIRLDGELVLAEVLSIHAEGGGAFSGPITGYRCRPMDDDGRYLTPALPSDTGVWVKPLDLHKDWMIRPSAANLDKARHKAAGGLF